MADKRISQLAERTDIANNDVVAIVASGATVTNKATISSIQSYMQTALDVGVTSVGVTLGSSGTDVSVTGSPITTSGNITINIPSASATNRGVLTSEDWSTFNAKQPAGNYLTTDTTQTITGAKTFDQDIFVNGRRIGRGAGNITSNTAVGNTALRDNTTGSENSAFGGGALREITTGSANTAVGFGSMLNSETGGGNTAIGNSTLAGNNGSNNIAVGNSAGRYIAGGTTLNETSLNSVYLGANTRPSADGNTNEIVIGENAVGNGSNTVTIGKSSTTDNYFTGTVRSTSLRLAEAGTANPTILRNTSGTNSITANTNVLGFNNVNNIFVTTESRGGFILGFNNTVSNREYTLQDASGTLAFTSDIPSLAGFVTLDTVQTITAQKTFSTSGGSDTLIVNHTSGSGIALDISKAGNGEGLRVTKTSGSGNAVTITGGLLSAEAATLTGALNGTSAIFTGDLQSQTRLIAATGGQQVIITPNLGAGSNRIESTGSLPMALVSAQAISLAAGGVTPQITLATDGAVTLTGALNGTSASFTGQLTANGGASGVGLRVVNNTNSRVIELGYSTGSGSNFIQSYDGSSFQPLVLNNALTLASTGAATFSSSVTATSAPSLGGFQVQALSNSAGSTSYGGVVVQSVNGKAGYLTSGDNSTTTWYGAQASFVSLGATLGAGIKLRVDADDTKGITIPTSGNVGIGTASPSHLCELQKTNASSFFRTVVNNTTDGLQSGIIIDSVLAGDVRGIALAMFKHASISNAASYLSFRSGGSAFEYMYIDDSSVLRLSGVSGNIGTANGTIVGTQTSDIRLKNVKNKFNYGLNEILEINPIAFTFKKDKNQVEKLGFSAQEMLGIIPESVYDTKECIDGYTETEDPMVKTPNSEDTILGMDYTMIIPVLVKAIQELKTEIDSLKNV